MQPIAVVQDAILGTSGSNSLTQLVLSVILEVSGLFRGLGVFDHLFGIRAVRSGEGGSGLRCQSFDRVIVRHVCHHPVYTFYVGKIGLGLEKEIEGESQMLHRRQFLGAGVATATFAYGLPALHGADSTKKYRTALIGSGWFGKNVMFEAIDSGRCEIVALCDVDQNMLKNAQDKVEERTGNRPKGYGDFRDLLDEQKPEIVIVSTPDHWHPLIAIAAAQAGAHVYVEKPVGHTVLEGRAMTRAARAADRKMQVNTHRRASPHNIAARKFIQDGNVGKIGSCRAFVHYSGGAGTPVPDEDPPAYLDWNMYCGPSRLRPYNRLIHPGGFRQFYDFANGQLGDWGIHWMDQILWCMDEQYPSEICSVGGRFIREDSTETPDTQFVQFKFDSFDTVWEHRNYAANHAEKHNVGIYFYGTKGTLHLGWEDGWTFYPQDGGETQHMDPVLHLPDKQNIKELFHNFLESIEGRETLISDIEGGHRSTAMSLLGVLSMKLGRSITWDGEKEICVGDEEATQKLRRTYREPWVYPDV
ncbi:MAG: Gfo/Idh/MocA family oxidoreductase [Thermoguttaceae bacterium]|nr:Gfo/Idh/MocA family oxidoreductase [Thermoguttaceae bacterium]